MARKTKVVTIESEGRDKGKSYKLTEMSAYDTEMWASRALLALSRSGIALPDEVLELGFAAMLSESIHQILAGIAFDEAKPLLDEMFGCVQALPDPAQPLVVRSLIDDDIEELTTRLKLRAEVLELHTGFPVAAALSTLGAAARNRIDSTGTSTSPTPSEPSSLADAQA